MRVEDIGELIDRDIFWRLIYDDCGHIQEFAREDLDDLDHAALYVKRHFAHCLTCAISRSVPSAAKINADPAEIRLVLSQDEMNRLIDSLRQTGDELLAQRLTRILRQALP